MMLVDSVAAALVSEKMKPVSESVIDVARRSGSSDGHAGAV
jgi:hypothetical protein